MGLHRLGTNPETMPPDDPALPPGKNSIKRETAVRLFNMLVAMDSVLSDSSQFRCYVSSPILRLRRKSELIEIDDLAATSITMSVSIAHQCPKNCVLT